MKVANRLGLLVACGAVFVAGCAAPRGGSATGQTVDGVTSDNPATSSGPKTIRLAVDASSEPSGGMLLIGRGGAVGLEN